MGVICLMVIKQGKISFTARGEPSRTACGERSRTARCAGDRGERGEDKEEFLPQMKIRFTQIKQGISEKKRKRNLISSLAK
jgi:hypothetical protein